MMTELGQNIQLFRSHIYAVKWWSDTSLHAVPADRSTLYSTVGQGTGSGLKPIYNIHVTTDSPDAF